MLIEGKSIIRKLFVILEELDDENSISLTIKIFRQMFRNSEIIVQFLQKFPNTLNFLLFVCQQHWAYDHAFAEGLNTISSAISNEENFEFIRTENLRAVLVYQEVELGEQGNKALSVFLEAINKSVNHSQFLKKIGV